MQNRCETRRFRGLWDRLLDVKVIDFGLALTAGLRAESRSVHPSRRSTRDLATAGTLKYAAPEQLGEAAYPVGPHSDVYAFGKTALEALLGTTGPTPRHWKQLPDTLADLLGRCIDEDYDAANPAEGRFHDFKPVLAGLRPPVVTPAPPPVVPPAVVPEEFIKLDIVVPKPTPPTLPGRRTTGDKHEVTLPGNVKLPMAWCPPGQFRRRNDSGDSQEKPTHVVTLTKGYWMGVTPVTQAQWRAVMGSDPSHFKGPNPPAEQVSWDDATTFNAKLTRLVGRVMRLPTDAEWEYACRAGTTTECQTGDGEAALKLAGWYVGNSGGQTHEIGQLAPNAWGLHDCHGNVWEWCVDWFPDATYHRGYCTDPTGLDGGSARLLRGGSWPESATRCRSAYLVSVEPATQGRGLGFRVAASSVGTEQ